MTRRLPPPRLAAGSTPLPFFFAAVAALLLSFAAPIDAFSAPLTTARASVGRSGRGRRSCGCGQRRPARAFLAATAGRNDDDETTVRSGNDAEFSPRSSPLFTAATSLLFSERRRRDDREIWQRCRILP